MHSTSEQGYHGQFEITFEMVENNQMGWDKFDFFRYFLEDINYRESRTLPSNKLFMYAHMIDHDFACYRLRFCDVTFKNRCSEKYFESLEKDGWIIETMGL